MAQRYRLKIRRLDFISAVDAGAQGDIANVALIKRAPTGVDIEAVCKVASIDKKMGLVFGWALASSLDGGATPHVDLQQDAIVGGDDLIKIAAQFMEDSAASDVMHDENPDGKIVFCMPLVPDVCKALGIETNTHGLAIAMKPSAETFKRFVSKELNAFSIGGIGDRTPLEKRKPKSALFRRVVKNAVLTSENAGHAHSIDLDDPACGWTDMLFTSAQVAAGADVSHSHAWVYNPTTGAVSIAADSGHSHTCTAVVSPEVIAAAAVEESEELLEPEVSDEEPPATNITVITARRKSTHAIAPTTVKATTEKAMTLEEATAKIAELEKQLADLQAAHAAMQSSMDAAATKATMDDAQKAYLKSLDGDDAKAFLAKSAVDRAALVAKATEIVHISKSTGEVYHANDDKRLVEMAKRMDAQADEIEKADIRKTAAECLGGIAGGDDVHDYIVKSIRKSGGDAAMIAKALESLKSANAFAKDAGKPRGANPGLDPIAKSAQAALEECITKYMADHKVDITKATVAVANTIEGQQLYAAVEKAKRARA